MSTEKLSPEIIKDFLQLIKLEDKKLLERRKRLFVNAPQDEKSLKETKFGIALSGGGIRSATINLGILKTFNKFGVLKKADYLSTVSGGGYTGAYVQATLKNEGSYEKLFEDKHVEYMRSRGEYLMPGTGWMKKWNILILTVGFVISLLMSWMSPVIIVTLFYIGYTMIGKISNMESWLTGFRGILEGSHILTFSIYILGSIFLLHFIVNIALKYSVGVSRRFNQLESIFIGLGLVWLVAFLLTGLTVNESLGKYEYWHYGLAAILLVIAGFFTNPNALSFHRFYRNQLAEAYLHFTGDLKNVRLKDLFSFESGKQHDYLAPYPLINTCLNLQATSDERFSGSKTSDYFLLSPLYCGAKLTGYVNTTTAADYRLMTLPAATTISAAAVNPGMGMYSNKLLSIIMTLVNARLGFWVANPLKRVKSGLVWWPIYFFYELMSLIGTDNYKLNISDGGHIENLGVYELLRRKCRLIISVDAGADPTFTFSDLENLTIRARNELGVDIHFRDGNIPEEVIRPKPSHGYSEKRFAIADIYQLWEEITPEDKNGDPILDKKGNKVNVLVNYNKVRSLTKLMNDKECREMEKVIATLNVQENINDIIDTLGIKDKFKIKKVVDSLTQNSNLRALFSVLLKMLRDANVLLEKQLEGKLKDDALVQMSLNQVVDTIENRMLNLLKVGTFVYIKSSVTAPEGKPQLGDRNSLAYGTYKYKIYHPSFPHEPTSDQFFDKIQWEAYFQLGQFIGSEVIGDADLITFSAKAKEQFNIEQLLDHFDNEVPLFEIRDEEIVPEQTEETLVQLEPLPSMAAPKAEEEEVDRSESVSSMTESVSESKASIEAPIPKAEDEKVVLGEEVQYKM
ncbi:MAG: hypothetical protein ACI8P3_001317 [Saprospiraceae bacterium]|jgi:hypothetical protein